MVAFIGFLMFLSLIGMAVGVFSLPVMILNKKWKKSLKIFGVSFLGLVLLFLIYDKAVPESVKAEANASIEAEKAETEAEAENTVEETTVEYTEEETTTEAEPETTTEEATEAPTETGPPTEPSTKETTTSAYSEDQLMETLKANLSEDVAEKAYDIIVNQIGFTGVEYKGKNSMGTDNYDFSADHYNFTLTASDDVYRIFQPGGANFYVDGEVKIKLTDVIDQYDAVPYMQIAEEIVKQNLKNPRSAKFPSIVTHSSDIAMMKKDDIVAVQSYVDATNSYGAKIRTQWTVEFKVIDLAKYEYQTIYIKIGDNSTGSFIDLN